MAITTVTFGGLEILTAGGISVPHGFTTRRGGVSTGVFDSLNLGAHRGDDPENVAKNHGLLAAALGYAPENLVMTRQVHSDIVRAVTKADHLGFDHHGYPESDALITCDPGTALLVFTADCTPILLQDPVTGAVGAIHAGWRGTAADIAGKTAKAMQTHFGCDPKNIRAAIGPNIGQCCFETGPEVPQAIREALGAAADSAISAKGEKYYVNLKEINALILRRAGVRHIDISEDCTVCQSSRFWSHRVTGGQRGSQGAVIVCREVQK